MPLARLKRISASVLVALAVCGGGMLAWNALLDVLCPFPVCFDRGTKQVQLDGQASELDPDGCIHVSRRTREAKFRYVVGAEYYRLTVWPSRVSVDSPIVVVRGEDVQGPPGSFRLEKN
jgi:hypothetical protein